MCGVKSSLGSRSGAKYRTASGNLLTNQGDTRITMRTEAGDTRVRTFQIADVTKPLASAGRITSKGHIIVLDEEDSYIQHKESGRKVAAQEGQQRLRDAHADRAAGRQLGQELQEGDARARGVAFHPAGGLGALTHHSISPKG